MKAPTKPRTKPAPRPNGDGERRPRRRGRRGGRRRRGTGPGEEGLSTAAGDEFNGPLNDDTGFDAEPREQASEEPSTEFVASQPSVPSLEEPASEPQPSVIAHQAERVEEPRAEPAQDDTSSESGKPRRRSTVREKVSFTTEPLAASVRCRCPLPDA